MSETRQKIESKVNEFVTGLEKLLQQEALDQIRLAFGSVPSAAKATLAREPRTKRESKAISKTGVKRAPNELSKLTAKVAKFVQSNPEGANIAVIRKALNVSSRELFLPIRKLLTEKLITKKGERRATRYFPPAAKKGAAKKNGKAKKAAGALPATSTG